MLNTDRIALAAVVMAGLALMFAGLLIDELIEQNAYLRAARDWPASKAGEIIEGEAREVRRDD